MSPEQVRGQTVDARSDIWAFGCVAYETLAGRRAFDRETAADTLSAILNEEPDWELLPPETPVNVRSVLARCLEKDTRRRLHSIADARIEIENSIADPGVTTGQVPEPVPAPSRGRLGWIAAAFAALAAVALAADIGGLRSTLFAGWGDRTSGSDAGDAAATTLESVRSLVALPSSLTGAEEQRYLADAIPNRLTAELVRSAAVAMRQPPSQESVDGVDGNLALLASTYAVDGLLKSTVVVGQEEFTLQLTLIGSNGQDVLWASNEYAGELGQFIDPVREAASELAAALGDETTALPQPTSENAEAQLALEEGRWFTGRYNGNHLAEDYALAHSAFERALALEPTLADAAAELAGLVYLQAETGSPPDGAAEEFEGWIDQALRLDPRNGRAWTVRSMAMTVFGTSQDFATELDYALRGVVFAPELAGGHSILGTAIGAGANRLSRPAYERAMSLDPMYVHSGINLALSQLLRAEYDDALATMNGALAIGPNMPLGLLSLASALIATGQYTEAGAAIDRVIRVDEERFSEDFTLATRAELAVARGDVVAADELTERMLAMIDAPEADYMDAVHVAYFAGESFAISRPAVALRLLLRASELGVLLPFDALRDAPRFDPLRSEPEFLNLLAGSRQSYDIVISTLQAAQRRGELPAYLEEPLALEVQTARDEG